MTRAAGFAWFNANRFLRGPSVDARKSWKFPQVDATAILRSCLLSLSHQNWVVQDSCGASISSNGGGKLQHIAHHFGPVPILQSFVDSDGLGRAKTPDHFLSEPSHM